MMAPSSVCVRAHSGRVYGFLVVFLQIVFELFALFYHSVVSL